MPMISAHTNVPVSKQTADALRTAFGSAITLLPGKTEDWLMVEVRGGCSLCFKGSDAPCAVAEVAVFGTVPDDAYDRMTAAVTEILAKELSVPASRIYVRYEECEHWGWNGSNF